jgi:hypothetical protein
MFGSGGFSFMTVAALLSDRSQQSNSAFGFILGHLGCGVAVQRASNRTDLNALQISL